MATEGTLIQTRVPIVYGDPSWMVAQIIKGQSANTLMPSPMMAAWIGSIDMAPERRQDPAHESQVNAIERSFENGKYGTEVGNRYTVQRYMPVPYNMTMHLDIWTTTTTTKLQILEQILTIFNPMVQLQQIDNKFDWTSIFELELTNIIWTNRGVVQSDSERDIASLEFKVPVWINPPAKVRRIKMIEQIVVNVNTASDLSEIEINKELEDPMSCLGNRIGQCIVTPGNFRIGVGTNGIQNNEIILLNKYGAADPTLNWRQLFEAYGNIQDNETLIRLKLDSDIEVDTDDILGTVAYDDARPNILTYTVDEDTLPSTINGGPITDAVDPQKQLPGKELPIAVAGQRYLMLGAYTNGEEPATPDAINSPWGIIRANENDIIEYDGTEWFISFDSSTEATNQNVLNLRTMNLYRFTGSEWVFTYLGEYFPGYWRVENLYAKAPIQPIDQTPGEACDD